MRSDLTSTDNSARWILGILSFLFHPPEKGNEKWKNAFILGRMNSDGKLNQEPNRWSFHLPYKFLESTLSRVTSIGFINWGVDNLNFTTVDSLKNTTWLFKRWPFVGAKRQLTFFKLSTMVKFKLLRPQFINPILVYQSPTDAAP